MKVSQTLETTVVKDPKILRDKIVKKYGNIRRFSKKAGFTESMVCHILHGRRKLYPWSRESFVTLLEIPKTEYDIYFRREA
jgi:hypothetical protein